MDKMKLHQLLEDFKTDRIGIDRVIDTIKELPFEDLGFAKVDHHRALRNGFPEVIFCQGKTDEQIRDIFVRLAERSNSVLATRAVPSNYTAVKELVPDAEYYPLAKMIVLRRPPFPKPTGRVLVISAGTADLPVAEEAALTAEAMGNEVERLYDVGVAGLHRLLAHKGTLFQAHVLIVVAGMEGALASVVGGLVDKPVIAVPTSVGYGASFGGLAALLSMLNSCAKGVGVVNIDNGFGAAALANAITRIYES